MFLLFGVYFKTQMSLDRQNQWREKGKELRRKDMKYSGNKRHVPDILSTSLMFAVKTLKKTD